MGENVCAVSSYLQSCLRDPERLNKFIVSLIDKLEYPREMITYFVKKVDQILTEDANRRMQDRQFTKMVRKISRELLAYIDEVKRLQSMCTIRRKRLIMAELSNKPDGERFDSGDKEIFPQTIGFLQELDLRLRRIKEKREEVMQCCEMLNESSGDASARTQTSEIRANWFKNGAKVVGFVALGIGGIAISGGTFIFFAGGSLVGAALAGGSGAGLLAVSRGAFVASRKFCEREIHLKEIKTKIDSIHDRAERLEIIVNIAESKGKVHSLINERDIQLGLEENPLLTCIEWSMETVLSTLTAERNFDDEREEVDKLLQATEKYL